MAERHISYGVGESTCHLLLLADRKSYDFCLDSVVMEWRRQIGVKSMIRGNWRNACIYFD